MHFRWFKQGMVVPFNAATIQALIGVSSFDLYTNNVVFDFLESLFADFTLAVYPGYTQGNPAAVLSGPFSDNTQERMYYKANPLDFGKNTGPDVTVFGALLHRTIAPFEPFGVLIFDAPLLIPTGGDLKLTVHLGVSQLGREDSLELDLA